MHNLRSVSDLFNIVYGVNLELVNLERCDKSDIDSINFVSRSERNNGISAFVKRVDGLIPNPAHTLSVAGGGSVLSTFYQPQEYYSGRDLYVLIPKKKMTVVEMLFYANCIKQNRYRYSYGRQANKTLPTIMIPSKIPASLKKIEPDKLAPVTKESVHNKSIDLKKIGWKYFNYGGNDGIFMIKNGYYNKKPTHTEKGNIPFIGSSEYNNGVTEYYTLKEIEKNNVDVGSTQHPIEDKLYLPNCITVANNGASTGSAFYQDIPFTCSHDVNVLYLKDAEMNKFIALFLCTLIRLEKYRWSYGRKWRPSRMPDSKIMLPVNSKGTPDWKFMEDFIKSLPYSASI